MSSEFDFQAWYNEQLNGPVLSYNPGECVWLLVKAGFRKGQEQACKRILKEFHKMMKAEQRQEVYIHLDELNELIDKILKESK